MVEKKNPFSTTSILRSDLPRIHALRRDRENRQKHQSYKEDSAYVISRALDALEALEREQASVT